MRMQLLIRKQCIGEMYSGVFFPKKRDFSDQQRSPRSTLTIYAQQINFSRKIKMHEILLKIKKNEGNNILEAVKCG